MTPIARGIAQFDYWQQSGSVWLWRYQGNDRSYPGWHLTADRAGAASLVELLDTLAGGKQPTIRTVQVRSPTQAILSVPNNRSAEWTAPAKLRVGLADDPTEWIFAPSDEVAQLTFGLDWCSVLRQAISRIPGGEGDFSIGPPDPSQRLWLWWHLT